MKRIHFFVLGEVQGVCYRYYATDKARELKLKGFVRNASDGKVEVFVEGENNKVNEFLAYCKKNPGYSNVEKLEIIEEKEIKGFDFNSFEIQY